VQIRLLNLLQQEATIVATKAESFIARGGVRRLALSYYPAYAGHFVEQANAHGDDYLTGAYVNQANYVPADLQSAAPIVIARHSI
jgi:hypothetical protein